MKGLHLLLLLGLTLGSVLGTSPVAWAQIYRWTDERGRLVTPRASTACRPSSAAVR